MAKKPKDTVGNKRQRNKEVDPVAPLETRAPRPPSNPFKKLREATLEMAEKVSFLAKILIAKKKARRVEKKAIKEIKIDNERIAKVNAAQAKINAAASRQCIIGRIKVARARKTLPVH